MKFAIAFIVLLVIVALVVWLAGPGLAFFPVAGETTTPGDFGIPHETVAIETADGEQLHAWAMTRAAPRAQIVYFHGNGGNLSIWAPILAGTARQGFSVFAVDYRGYGKSTGRPTERGLYRDVDAVVRQFWEKRREGVPIIYWGRSLGGTMAAYAATVRAPDGLILEASFPDVAALVKMSPPMKLLSLVTGFSFPTAAFLGRGEVPRVPILVMHGDRDSVIPFGQGRELFSRLTGPNRRFFTISGGDHNDAVPPDPRAYWTAVGEFVAGL